MKNFTKAIATSFLFLMAMSSCQKKSNELKNGFIHDNMNEERYAKDKKYYEDKAKKLYQPKGYLLIGAIETFYLRWLPLDQPKEQEYQQESFVVLVCDLPTPFQNDHK